ncbi:MAG: hypothetical protein M3485_01580 [Pseudomonadota bacterium]|nr:hypothetical protein [Pseudomonadota bacterium]
MSNAIQSNAIQFLESLGNKPLLAPFTEADYASAVSALEVDPMQRKALLDRDQGALSEQLGGRASMTMQIWTEEETPQDDEKAPDDRPDDEPGEHERPQDTNPSE